MLTHDVVALERFYQSDVGRVVEDIISDNIKALWPSIIAETLVGIGYAAPYVKPYVSETCRVFSLVPEKQGAIVSPALSSHRVAMFKNDKWPLCNSSVDRILMIHLFEHTENKNSLLREAWRVLKENGRLLVCVPNMRSLWAHLAQNPFRSGQSFTLNELSKILKDSLFLPLQIRTTLYTPPIHVGFLKRYYKFIEDAGQRWSNHLGGLILLDCAKTDICLINKILCENNHKRLLKPSSS